MLGLWAWRRALPLARAAAAAPPPPPALAQGLAPQAAPGLLQQVRGLASKKPLHARVGMSMTPNPANPMVSMIRMARMLREEKGEWVTGRALKHDPPSVVRYREQKDGLRRKLKQRVKKLVVEAQRLKGMGY
jgi:hypothetical protein